MIRALKKNSYVFPNPLSANEDGILCHGGDLHPNRILNAYKNGIFPWFNEGDPILWWCPNPRFVLEIQDLHISKNLKRTIKKNIFEIKYDTAFTEVMINCAISPRKNQDTTWISQEMISSYTELFNQGIAHSFEAWLDGKLVGGGYGIVIGDIFCGESMFSKVSDASKVAFVHVVNKLKENGFTLIDSQMHTPYLENFGAKHITRKNYLIRVNEALEKHKEF